MSERSKITFSLNINWKITLLSFVFFPLLIALGFWQLDRAKQKQTILDDWQEQQELPPLDINKISWSNISSSLNNRKVKLTGKFESEKYWLLEAKMYRGRVGYHVVMPFILESQRSVLVNRGWVAASAYRDQLPDILTPTSTIDILGNLTQVSTSVFVNEDGGDRQTWPHRLVQIDLPKMKQQSTLELSPFVIEIDKNDSAALFVDWQKINVLPSKHTGYAVQWFAMAATLLILWLFANSNMSSLLGFKKNH